MIKNVYLPEKTWEQLQALAQSRGVTINALATEAIECLLDGSGQLFQNDPKRRAAAAPQKKRKFYPRPSRRSGVI